MNIDTLIANTSELAKRENLPTGEYLRRLRFHARYLGTVELGDMIASVRVVPVPETDYVTLTVYEGEEEIAATLHGEVNGTTLTVSADLPFKPGRQAASHNTAFGVTIIDGDITIGSGSQVVGGSYMINGREVDLTRRPLHCVLEVPVSMDLNVCGLIGGIGIIGHLNARLTFGSAFNAALTAKSVRALSCNVSGRGSVNLSRILKDADITFSGHGTFTADLIDGAVDTRVTGHGEITIAGGTSSELTALITGRGYVNHLGVVAGPTRARVTGRGYIEVRHTNDRDPEVSVTGQGSIMINGTSYTRNW